MSIQTVVAQRYARAFLNVHAAQITESDMLNIIAARDYFIQQKDVLSILDMYDLDEKQFKQCITIFLAKFALISAFEQLIMLLKQKHRLFLFRDILKFIVWEYQAYTRRLYFELSSAINLSEKEWDTIRSFLNKLSGSDNIYKSSVDASLIAGIKAMSGDFLWENSIKSRLQKLNLWLT